MGPNEPQGGAPQPASEAIPPGPAQAPAKPGFFKALFGSTPPEAAASAPLSVDGTLGPAPTFDQPLTAMPDMPPAPSLDSMPQVVLPIAEPAVIPTTVPKLTDLPTPNFGLPTETPQVVIPAPEIPLDPFGSSIKAADITGATPAEPATNPTASAWKAPELPATPEAPAQKASTDQWKTPSDATSADASTAVTGTAPSTPWPTSFTAESHAEATSSDEFTPEQLEAAATVLAKVLPKGVLDALAAKSSST